MLGSSVLSGGCAAALGLLLAADAQAASGLEWKWEAGQTRRFLVRSAVEIPEPIDFLGKLNSDARISKFTLTMVLNCAAETALGKSAWLLRCDIDAAGLQALPLPAHVGQVGPIAEQWADVLQDEAWLQIVQRTDGKLKSVDLEGVDKSNDRFQRVAEWMRQMCLRAVAPLDIHLPRKGELEGDAWFQTSGMAIAAPSFTGGIGAVRWTHQIQSTDGAVLAWVDRADGTIQPGGESVDSSLMTLAMTLDGSARFDTALGALVESQYYAAGQATSSSAQSEAGRNARYVQTSYLQLLVDGVVPMVPASGELK
jgi:hypothetical protein